MKRTKVFLPFIAILIIMLVACQLSGGTTGTPGTGTATSVLNGTTPISSGGSNTFTSTENGVMVQYPQGWTTEPPASGDQSVVTFISPDQSVHSVLYVFPTQSGDTAQSVNNALAQSALNGLTDIQVISDAALTRSDGNDAWSKIVTAVSSNSSLMINLTTIINGSHSYFIMSFGIASSFTANSIDISSLLSGVSFVAQVVSGVDRSRALFLEGSESTNPRDYDPATEHDSGDKRLYSGLVSLDASLNITPELAGSWDLSSDGKIYTFHIRPNAKFHDGRAVTTQDVIYSWERAALPATQSDTVLTYLGDIVGVTEVHSGKTEHISGLKALDDHTLQVTIDAPKVYFLYKLTMPVAFVLDESNVESGSEWYRTPNGTGPYKLTQWDRFKLMVYNANQDFYLGVPSIPQVVVQIYTGSGIRLYQTNDIDITGVSFYDAQTVEDPTNSLHAELLSSASLCTSYVVFDVTRPPFDDIKVRQAFSMAFDKQKFIDVANNGVGIAAKGLYPPALPGYSLDLQGLPYDPEQARKLLSESKYGGAQGLPPIVYTEGGIGDSTGSDVNAMIAMWQQNLGVTINVQNIESNKYSDLLFSGQHGQLFTWGWCADYPDPENFADVLFHSGAQQNLGSYSDPALDAVLDQARVEKDVTARIKLYQQAESMIVQDAPAIFIMHDIEYLLVKPYVKGYVLTPISIPIERYLSIQH